MKKNLLYIFIIIALALLFLAQRKIVPGWVYALPACALGLYFCPVRLIRELIKNSGGAKTIITTIVSCHLYAGMLIFAYYRNICPEFFQCYAAVFGILNALTGFVYHFFSIDEEKARLHFIMSMFYCVW